VYPAWSVLMEFTYIEDGIDAIVIDNFYTEEQMEEIMLELKWLTKPSIMLKEDKLSAAEDNGKILTSKSGVFLETVFANWQHSALISHAMTQTNSQEFKDKLLEYNTMFKSLFHCNSRSHLVSYYENSDYYKSHTDAVFFTVLNYFNTEPKQFTGGEIVLKSCINNKEATIEPLHNRTVVILSSTLHEVKPIVSTLSNTLSGNGRYCNAIFLTTMDQREPRNDSN
jgi:hypothetical protein